MDSVTQQNRENEQGGASGRHPFYRVAVRIVGCILLFLAARNLVYGKFVLFLQELGVTLVFFLVAPFAWSIGDAFRRYAKPDWYLATGSVDAAQKRFFWTHGPQLYGVIGVGAVAVLLCIGLENPPTGGKHRSEAAVASAAVNGWPESVVAEVVNPCVDSASKGGLSDEQSREKCACAASKLQEWYDLDEYRKLEAGMTNGDEAATAKILKAFSECK